MVAMYRKYNRHLPLGLVCSLHVNSTQGNLIELKPPRLVGCILDCQFLVSIATANSRYKHTNGTGRRI